MASTGRGQAASRRVLVAIPVYNEAESLPSLYGKLAGLLARPAGERPAVAVEADRAAAATGDAPQAAATGDGPDAGTSGPAALDLLFVDDGSSDLTGEVLRGLADGEKDGRVRVVTHPANLGLGAAVGTILAQADAVLGDDDILVTLDGDDTHDPALIPLMVGRLIAEDLDLVVASRFTPGGAEVGLSPYRRLLSRGASAFFRLFFPIRGVTDYSSGFRAYRMSFIRKAAAIWGDLVTTTGFDCMAEIMAKFSRLKPRAAECPLVLRYDQKRGQSKMRVGRTIRGYLRLLRKAA